MISEPRIEIRAAHPYVAVRMRVTIPFGEYLQPAWTKIHHWLTRRGISHGPAIIRYLTTEMSGELDIDVGYVVDQAMRGDDGIIADTLPGGQYATLRYTGPYAGPGVYEANVALVEWAKANGIIWKTSEVDGADWWAGRVEWYLSDPETEPDPEKYQTELTFMVADGQ